jgi:hypothetical protein
MGSSSNAAIEAYVGPISGMDDADGGMGEGVVVGVRV